MASMHTQNHTNEIYHLNDLWNKRNSMKRDVISYDGVSYYAVLNSKKYGIRTVSYTEADNSDGVIEIRQDLMVYNGKLVDTVMAAKALLISYSKLYGWKIFIRNRVYVITREAKWNNGEEHEFTDIVASVDYFRILSLLDNLRKDALRVKRYRKKNVSTKIVKNEYAYDESFVNIHPNLPLKLTYRVGILELIS